MKAPVYRYPAHWCEVEVGDVVESADYGSSMKASPTGDVPVLRMGNIVDGKIDATDLKYLPADHPDSVKLVLEDGDVLFNRTNSPELVGKAAVFRGHPARAIPASYLIRVRLKPEYDPGFLTHFLNSEAGRAWASTVVTQQVGQANINGSKLKQLRVPLPPIREQRATVAELDRLFGAGDEANNILQGCRMKLAAYRAAVLRAACEGRLVPTEESAPVEKTVGDFTVSLKNGLYKPASEYAEDGIACLRMYNINGGRVVWRDIKRIRLSDDEAREYELRPGDVLVNRVNSRELVGKAAAFPPGLERCVFESKNIRLRIDGTRADPEYVAYHFHVYGPAHFTANAQQVVGMASISQPQVKSLRLNAIPLDAQHRIVAEVERRLSVVERLEAAIDANLARAKRLRQAILKRAFEGRLVPQDPNDEPASLLLERIRREREAKRGETPPRRTKRAPREA